MELKEPVTAHCLQAYETGCRPGMPSSSMGSQMAKMVTAEIRRRAVPGCGLWIFFSFKFEVACHVGYVTPT